MTEQEPVFEIHYGEGKCIEIFVDGGVKGMPIDWTMPVVIINRIPQLLANAYSDGVQRR